MTTLLFTLALFLLVVAGMALGAMLQNKPLKGSCGGLNAVGIGGDCEICGGDLSKCEESDEPDTQSVDSGLVTDAMKKAPSK